MTAGGTTDVFELGRALAVVLDSERPRAIVTHSLGFPIALQALTVGAAAPPTWVALVPGRKMSHALARFGVKRSCAPPHRRPLAGARFVAARGLGHRRILRDDTVVDHVVKALE